MGRSISIGPVLVSLRASNFLPMPFIQTITR
jgi:hypothetical protein